MEDKFLPIGTVVLLKDARKRLMITGYCSYGKPKENEKEVMFDYTGCLFPEGIVLSTKVAMFNHNQIEKIYHMGLVDVESKKFTDKLKQITSAMDLISPIAPEEVLKSTGIEKDNSN